MLDALLRLLLVLLDADLALLVEELLYLAAIRLERVHDLDRVLLKLANALVLVDALLVLARPEGSQKVRLGFPRRRDNLLEGLGQLELDEASLVQLPDKRRHRGLEDMTRQHLALLEQTVRQLAVRVPTVVRNDERVEELLLLQLGGIHLLQLLHVVEALLEDAVHVLTYHILYLVILSKQLILVYIELVKLANLGHELQVRPRLHGVRALHYLEFLEVSPYLPEIGALQNHVELLDRRIETYQVLLGLTLL